MNIAIYVSPLDTVPVQSDHILAPWYLAEDLVPGLVARGHTVTTYCAEGSKLPGTMVTGGITSCIGRIEEMEPRNFGALNTFGELRLASLLFEEAGHGAYDVIHVFQGSVNVLPFAPLVSIPVVCTIHDPFSSSTFSLFREFGRNKNVTSIALSKSHSRNFPDDMPSHAVVGNGIPVRDFPFSPDPGSYLITCGRIVPEKGHEDAIEAVGTKEQLIIAGKYYKNDPTVYSYWLTKILPNIDGKRIRYAQFARDASYKKLLAGAKALLLPIRWEEPFGLVMVEAMACGTPVVAYNRGSVQEIVKDGVTGFIVDPDDQDRPGRGSWIIQKQGIEGLREGMKRISEIDRVACRKHVEEHFTVEKMVEGYEKVYENVLKKSGE